MRTPGAYPVTDATRIDTVVSVAGGVTREADLTRVEVTRFTPNPAQGLSSTVRGLANLSSAVNLAANPGDTIRFNAVFSDCDAGPVLLAGEFVRPGFYDIRRGECLYELIARAGGLTAQAYPYGAIFTRERVKRAEREGFVRAARELTAAAALASTRQGVNPQALLALQEVTRSIATTEPPGRIVMGSDPTVLQLRPEFDLVLEPRDTLFMPKRPNSVLVIGDVLNPGALQFVPGARPDDYIGQTGGFQKSADRGRVFLVYPNGVAQPLAVSVWSYNPVQIPPDSTIVVPKNPAPLDLLAFARDVTSVLSQIAVTAASLAVISN